MNYLPFVIHNFFNYVYYLANWWIAEHSETKTLGRVSDSPTLRHSLLAGIDIKKT